MTRAIPGHQARVLEGTTPQGAGQIRYDARPVPIALHALHMPSRRRRVTQAVQELDNLLRPHRLGQGERPTREGLADRRPHLPQKTAMTTRAGNSKP